jgi:hypothetical protein
MQRALTVVLCVCVSLSAAAKPAPAPDAATNPDDYRRLIDEAIREFDARNFEESLTLFERAYEIRRTARVLRGIGKVLFEMRQYTRSLEALERALASLEEPLSGALRDSAEELRARASRYVGTVTFQVSPATAELLLDGRPLPPDKRAEPVRLDLGAHVVELSAAGHLPARRTIDVGGGSDERVSIALVSTQRPSRTLLWTGVALDAAFAAALFGSIGWFVDRNNAYHKCADAVTAGIDCVNSRQIASDRDYSIAGLSVSTIGLAAGLVVTGLAARKLRAPRHAAAPRFAWMCAPGRDGGTCSGSFAW